MPESNTMVEMTDGLQGRDVVVNKVDEVKTQRSNEENNIVKLEKEYEETRKELEKARRRLSEINEDDKNKRFKIDELNKTIETKEEREASLQREVETLKQKNLESEKVFSEKEKELKTLRQELTTFKEEQEKAKSEAEKQEEEKRAGLIRQAEIASKKQNDPDILRLVQEAKDNATRELILNKLKTKKVDTVKVTELSSFYSTDKKGINILSTSVSELSKLKDSNPELYEDIINQAVNIRWQ